MVAAMPMGTVELVERDAEVGLLDSLLDEARYGRGRVLVFEGEPGIGKTALVEAAVAGAEARNMQLLAARGSELERGFAFGVVRQALERIVIGRNELFAGRAGLARSMFEPPPAQRSAGANEGVLDGLYWLLAELADAEPLLLAIDDAHWGDEESVAFLRFLALRLAGVRAAVLVATRPPAAGDALAGLLADPAVDVARPDVLGLAGADRYLRRQLAGEPSSAFVTACHAATGGNPFLLTQLAQALRIAGIEPSAEQAAHVAELRPPGLGHIVLGRLDAPSRGLARAVAVLGDDVSVGLAAELAALAPAAAEPAADALAAAGVFADHRPLRFRHELWRGAVLAAMPAGEQASARAAAVRVLRERGAAAERIAAQLLKLEPRGVPGAAATLREAAARASACGAPASAAALLRRALEEPLDRSGRFTVLMELGVEEQSLGRAEAPGRFIDAGRIAPAPDRRRAAAIAAGHAAALDPARCQSALELLDAIDLPGGDRHRRRAC